MASIPFHVIKHGAERIPDKAFEKIPFAGPRFFQEKDRDKDKDKNRDKDRDRRKKKRDKRSNRDRDSDSDQSDSYSDSDYDRSPRSSRPARSHRRSQRNDRRDDRAERGYESDQGPQSAGPRGYAEPPFFPPPPTIAFNDPEPGQRSGGEGGAGFVPRPYNPQEYGERPGSRDSYYAGHPQEQEPYTPPPPPGGPSQAPAKSAAGSYNESDRHSSVADRYRPANYDQSNRNASPASYEQYNRNTSPAAQQHRGSPNPAYPMALTLHPHAGYDPYAEYANPGYNTYQPPYDEEEEPRRRRGSRSRSRTDKGHSRSRSRIGEATEKAKDGFEKHKKELGVSALGALAGGIIGNEFGGKKSSMGMLLGAAIGGLGGGLYERKNEEKKMRKKLERRNSKLVGRDGYDSY